MICYTGATVKMIWNALITLVVKTKRKTLMVMTYITSPTPLPLKIGRL